eukprot:GILK01009615.1.p1 GENE.GILK01009615.1~~GILK01009615.1.p1  ORF type:complete len:940 (-),score=172.60 GILK01009615.1:16-2835(-)
MQAQVQEVVSAVTALNNDPNVETKARADKWLRSFQRTSAAWQVSDQILSTAGAAVEVYHFAALTLRTKIMFDFSELPDNTHMGLRDSLMGHIQRFWSIPLIRRGLCIAMADLAIQMEASWNNPVQYLIEKFYGTPESMECLLDLLTYLPEEIRNDHIVIRVEGRWSCRDTLEAAGSIVLNLLRVCCESTQSVETKTKILGVFSRWVAFCNYTAQELVHNPLIALTFEGLSDPNADPNRQEVSADCVCELLKLTSRFDLYQSIISVLIPNVMALKPKFVEALRTEDDADMLLYSRIFCELGEAYIELIVQQPTPEMISIVEILLETTAQSDRDMVSMTFRFWSDFVSMLSSSQGVTDVTKQLFSPAISKLLQLLIGHLQFPSDWEKMKEDQRDDFYEFRTSVGDLLFDICDSKALGTDLCLDLALHILRSHLAQYNSTQEWRAMEAALYAVRSISKHVVVGEEVRVPQLITVLPQLPTVARLQQTAIVLIGEYSIWLFQRMHLLMPLFPLILSGFANVSTVGASALALRDICTSCSTAIVPMFPDLLKVFDNSSQFGGKDQDLILEGLMAVVTVMPENTVQALDHLCTPYMSQLHQLLQNSGQAQQQVNAPPGSTPDSSGDSRVMGHGTVPFQLERLVVVFRHAQRVSDAVMSVVTKYWYVFQGLLEVFQHDKLVVEQTCRCLKHVMRAAKEKFSPLLLPLLTIVARLFQVRPHSSFLYVAEVSVSIFGSDAQYIQILQQLFQTLAFHALSVLQNTENFVTSPEVVSDFFGMTGRYLRSCPSAVFECSLLANIVQCAILGLPTPHDSSSRSIYRFFEFLLLRTKSNSALPAHKQSSQQIWDTFGANISEGVIRALSTLPEHLIEHIPNFLQLLVQTMGQTAHPWLVNALNTVPAGIFTEKEKREFLEDIFDTSPRASLRYRDAINRLLFKSRQFSVTFRE